MRQPEWEAGATPDAAGGGLTRREALRRGTMAGLGLVWVTPQVASFSMTAQYAQATSPVPDTTLPENEGTQVETTDPTDPKDPTDPTTESEVDSVIVENTPTTQPSVAGTQVEAQAEIQDEVLSGQLPFTGLPLEQLIPLAGGAIATGAAAVRMAREKTEEAEATE